MAILYSDTIVTVDDFIRKLRRAAASVVRITQQTSAREQGVCTGWFITPRLVVVPGYAVSGPSGVSPSTIRVDSRDDDGVTRSIASEGEPELLGRGAVSQLAGNYALALVRIAEVPPDRVLPFCFDVPVVGTTVTLLQFPEGRPDVSFSVGRVRKVDAEAGLISYDASTVGGSSGSPILDQTWRVLGLHMLGDARVRRNSGLMRSAMLDVLRTSRWWPEIAAHHRIADDERAAAQVRYEPESAAGKPPVDDVLVRAAVTMSLEPATLSKDEDALVRPLVADPNAARWTLRPRERRAILEKVDGFATLKRFRGKDASDGAGQRVIDEILDGPPYTWTDANEDALAWWIQAVRWFEGVAPDLPASADVAALLERRRARSRLDRIAGAGFRGRQQELTQLRTWFEHPDGPLLLTGVGGIGKSSLVARFALDLPIDTPLLWLDFDRADLAPDDASSVLGVLAEQASSQVEGFKAPPQSKEDWKGSARALGAALAQALKDRTPLLVLDSFEAAQYAVRYQELWPVLEQVCEAGPDMRVIVTGRAPVTGLRLHGRAAVAIHLEGLRTEDARAWLEEKGVADPVILDRVVELANGIPLILRLALRYLETGGRVEDLPRALPPRIVTGYLYDRILDRVQNPAFKPLAMGALILRRLTVDMIEPVLGGGLVEFPPGEPTEWMTELSREMALVEGTDVLRLRPEVRGATLALVEHERPDFVKQVDERAVAWFESRGPSDDEEAAELVYHSLRLGDIPRAARVWKTALGTTLTYAAEEIRDTAAREWLEAQLNLGTPDQPSVQQWEREAVDRIRSARLRKHDRAAKAILQEKRDRSNASPLIFHEAYELRLAGEGAAARKLLDDSGTVPGPIGRDRTVLRALLALDAGERRAADARLASVEGEEHWTDRPSGRVEALAISAARMSLTVDVDAELLALRALADPTTLESLRRRVASIDVFLPRLKASLASVEVSIELTRTVAYLEKVDLQFLKEWADGQRFSALPNEPAASSISRLQALEEWSRTSRWTPVPPASAIDPAEHFLVPPIVRYLAELGWRRWWLASHQTFLLDAYTLCIAQPPVSSALALAIFATSGIFDARKLALGGSSGSLADVIRAHPLVRQAARMDASRWTRVKDILTMGVDASHDWARYGRALSDDLVAVQTDELLAFTPSARQAQPIDVGTSLLFLVAPDPLQQLVADLAGRTDRPA